MLLHKQTKTTKIAKLKLEYNFIFINFIKNSGKKMKEYRKRGREKEKELAKMIIKLIT